MLALRGGRNTAWLRGRASLRVRLAAPRITCSVLVRDCYSSGTTSLLFARLWRPNGYARGKTKNADKSRTSHRTHPRDTHLRAREVVHYLCVDYHHAGDTVRRGASAMDLGATLRSGHRSQFSVLCAVLYSVF